MNLKNRFKVNDEIVQYLNDTEIIRKGTIVNGPIEVDKIDHYHVKWDWEHAEYGTPVEFKQEISLICDIPTDKFKYSQQSKN